MIPCHEHSCLAFLRKEHPVILFYLTSALLSWHQAPAPEKSVKPALKCGVEPQLHHLLPQMWAPQGCLVLVYLIFKVQGLKTSWCYSECGGEKKTLHLLKWTNQPPALALPSEPTFWLRCQTQTLLLVCVSWHDKDFTSDSKFTLLGLLMRNLDTSRHGKWQCLPRCMNFRREVI